LINARARVTASWVDITLNERHAMLAVGAMGIMGLIIICMILLTTLFWLWMLIDCITNGRLSSVEKLVWLLFIFFTHIIGAILYFFIGRPSRNTF
jgi:hypothetical protein